MKPVSVVGRFAPSPTGDLHFGSLISAVASLLEARSGNGKWLLRIEDIDPPREIPGSAQSIIADLDRLGMVADGSIMYQSSRTSDYQLVTEQLLDMGFAYPCACSRKDIPPSGIYPGTCKNGILGGKKPRSIRFRYNKDSGEFNDRIQGHISETTDGKSDFIIRRADGLVAYHLAVVVDDDYQGVTQVVRGADLLNSTNRQISLQRALGIKTPDYMHLPVALAANGKKLSKQHQADPVRHSDPAYAIYAALYFLGQNPPFGLSLSDLWKWALNHWNKAQIPRSQAILPDLG